MASSSHKFAPIYNKHKELQMEKNIPTIDIPLLEERLFITCTIYNTQLSTPGRGKNCDSIALSRQRSAQRVYLKVLEKYPGIFLAFILAISPRTCAKFNLLAFYEQHSEQPISLCDEASSLLWRVATKRGIQSSIPFKKAMDFLFKLPRPTTEADGDEHCLLSLSNLSATRIAFGDIICDAVECSSTYHPHNVHGDYAEMTECVTTRIPYNYQDTVVHLDVGCALKLADKLFPTFKVSLVDQEGLNRYEEKGRVLLGIEIVIRKKMPISWTWDVASHSAG